MVHNIVGFFFIVQHFVQVNTFLKAMKTVRQLYLALNCDRKKEEEIVGDKKLKF